MPVCPNKKSPAWESLNKGLKDKNPKKSDKEIEAMAYVAFFRKGDIPTVDEAVSLLFKGKTKKMNDEAKAAFRAFRFAKTEGGREKAREQKEFAARVREYLSTSETLRGALTPKQIGAIVRRASDIGTSEKAFERFTQYFDKVVQDANYDARMKEIRDLQKKAAKQKTALSLVIKEFTKINPEDIPLNAIDKYRKSLEDIVGEIKNPAGIRDMFYDVMGYITNARKDKEFENVKTIASAEKIFKQIKDNPLENVDDYKDAIRKTNALKRKLNELLEDGSIEQADYDAISKEIALNEEDFQERNKEAISAIKRDLRLEIASKEIKPKYKLTEQEQLLVEDIEDMKDIDRLSVSELYKLNESIDVANESYIDVKNLQDVLNAYNALDAKKVGEQLNKMKDNDKKTEEIVRRLMSKDDTFWEYVMGIPVSKAGEVYLQLITPYRKGIGQYVKAVNDTRKAMFLIEKQSKLSKEQHNKVGMIVHFLQEHARQFDPKYQGLKDIGKRDEFNKKLFDKKYTDKINSQETTKMLQGVYNSIPKGKDGKVDINDVYEDFVKGGNKYLTEAEREYLNLYWQISDNSMASKQEYANALRGRPFEKIDFYMPREEYTSSRLASAESPVTAARDNTNIKIKSSTGIERTARDIIDSDIPKTDFSYLMNKALSNTARDYHLTKMLQDLNNRLNTAYKNTDGNKHKYLDALVERMMEGLKIEINSKEVDASFEFVDKILNASAIKMLANPIRTFVAELPSGVVSYPIRGGTLGRGWAQMVKSDKTISDIKGFTNSPLAIKENIQAKFDADAQKVRVPSRLQKYVSWNSAFTERVINSSIWYPRFEDAFLEASGVKFNEKSYNSDPEYRRKYKSEINEAGTIADRETQEIIGSTTTASARATIDDIITTGAAKVRNAFTKEPIKSQLSAKSTWGRINAFMGGFVYRDYTQFFKGFKEASDGIRNGDVNVAYKGLLKPIGVMLSNATYGYMSAVAYIIQKYVVAYASQLMGFDREKELEEIDKLADKILKPKDALLELTKTGTQVMMGKYGSDSRIFVLGVGTLAYYAAKDDETKAAIREFVKDVSFQNIPKLDKIKSGYYGKSQAEAEIALAGAKSIATASAGLEALVNEAGGIADASKLVDKLFNGEDLGNKESLAQALSFAFSTAQILLIYTKGISIPESRKIQSMIDQMTQEAKKGKRKGAGGGIRMGGMGGGMKMGQ